MRASSHPAVKESRQGGKLTATASKAVKDALSTVALGEVSAEMFKAEVQPVMDLLRAVATVQDKLLCEQRGLARAIQTVKVLCDSTERRAARLEDGAADLARRQDDIEVLPAPCRSCHPATLSTAYLTNTPFRTR